MTTKHPQTTVYTSLDNVATLAKRLGLVSNSVRDRPGNASALLRGLNEALANAENMRRAEPFFAQMLAPTPGNWNPE